MSYIKKMGLSILGVLSLIAMLIGCSDPNAQATIFNPDTGKHITDWAAIHGSYYVSQDGQCNNCHGTRLQGGISSVGCFTNSSCHATVISCGTCHGDPPSGHAFPNTAGAHGVHTALSLSNPNLLCVDCHSGAGSGTPNHMNYVTEVAFSAGMLSVYKARSGAIAYDSTTQTCAKISCHGGITTPNWPAGSIDTSSQCTSCHTYGTSSGSPEYNSYYSGEHDKHVNEEGIGCTQCHDTLRLAVNHFTNLDTATMEGPASATMLNSLQYLSNSCNPDCHGSESW
jgi:predicted CxxxxCH...CXXCH cytochrome family protein